jgi:hypothetical protein
MVTRPVYQAIAARWAVFGRLRQADPLVGENILRVTHGFPRSSCDFKKATTSSPQDCTLRMQKA